MDLIPTLPSRYYRDAATWEIERRQIFTKTWVMVGLDHQLTREGDYFTEQVAGWPIFVQRVRDGSLRAFHNSCPHHGDPLVWEGSGNSSELVCLRHGWRFTEDGAFCGSGRVGADHPARDGLIKIRAQSWRGFIFVCLDPTIPDLLEWLGAFDAEWEAFPTGQYRFHSRTIRHAKINWKVYNDNFLEGYHLPVLHPELSRNVRALEFRVESKGDPRWNIQYAPARSDDLWAGVWGYFFPCLSFDIFPGGMAVERWLPVGKDRTDLIFEYFFADEAANVEEAIKACEQVADEDVRVCEMVQQNLTAGLYDTGWLSPKHERALAEFHQLVRDAVDG